ncbi:BtpA/SgcQ family protein, partial [uncultured Mesotoga sp.]
APLAMRPIEESAYDAAYFLADAVIISGKHTGFETPLEDLKKVRGVLPEYPIMVGSGMNKANAGKIFEVASGAFVGSTFKIDGDSYKSIDSDRVKDFMKVIKEIRNR